MKKVLIIYLLFVMLVATGLGQSLPVYNQYGANPMVINPAYAGSLEMLNLAASYRQQWTGIDGAPRTLSFSANAPIGSSRSGAALTLVSDKIGALDQTSVSWAYSYRIPFEFGSLSAGLSFGGYQLSTNLSGSNLSGIQDPAFNSGDLNQWQFNTGFGLFLRSEKYYVGFSIPRILNNEFSDNTDLFTLNVNRQYYVTGGYVFSVGTGPFSLKPYGLLRFESDTPYHLDISIQGYYKDLLSLGVQYRMSEATALLFGLILNKSIYIDYAFELPVGGEVRLSNTGTTHEIVLNYLLPWPDKSKELKMRYF